MDRHVAMIRPSVAWWRGREVRRHCGSNRGGAVSPKGWGQEGFLEELLLELSIGGQVGACQAGSREARHV